MRIREKAELHYRKLFETSGPERIQAGMLKDLSMAGITHSGKPLPFYAKPYLLEPEDREICRKAAGPLSSALEKITGSLVRNPGTRPLFFRGGPMDAYMAMPAPFPGIQVVTRMDGFYDPGRRELKVLEYNTDSPTGIGHLSSALDIYRSLAPMNRLGEKFRLHPDLLIEALHAALLEKYHRCSERRGIEPVKKPFLVVVCSRHFRYRGDMVQCARGLRRLGTDAVWADPRDLEYNGNRLTLKGREVHVIYRDAAGDFIRSEFFGSRWPAARLRKAAAARVRLASRKSRAVARIFRRTPLGSGEAALRAYRDGRVCMVNAFSARLGSVKAVMAYMSDGTLHSLLTDEEKDAVARHIPWSRRLIDSTTHFQGETIRLLPFVRANRERLVLKPCFGYGGYGVLIGRDLEDRGWLQRIDAIQESGMEYLVQEALSPSLEKFPVFERGRYVGYEPRRVNLNLWVMNGKLAGTNIRASTKSIINVSQGGGIGLSFYVDGPVEK